MRRVALILCCAMCAAVAAASTAVATPPEFGRCAKVAKGSGIYANSGCTKTGGHLVFEWQPGPPALNQFVIETSHQFHLENEHGLKFNCEGGESATGEYSGPGSVSNVRMVLTRCVAGLPCHTAGSLEGEVVLEGLSGTLGVWKEGKTPLGNSVGLDLSLGETEMECSLVTLKLRGSAVARVQKNKTGLTTGLTLVENKGRQKPGKLIGGPIDVPEISVSGAPFEPAAIELGTAIASEEAVEVNSVV